MILTVVSILQTPNDRVQQHLRTNKPEQQSFMLGTAVEMILVSSSFGRANVPCASS